MRFEGLGVSPETAESVLEARIARLCRITDGEEAWAENNGPGLIKNLRGGGEDEGLAEAESA